MWTDERGSEVLGLLECRRLLALGARESCHGHLGLPDDAGPVVLPVNYAMHGPDVVLLVGEHLFARLAGSHVAFQVDGVALPRRYLGEQDSRRWSVLVRGLAIEEAVTAIDGHVPAPEVLAPGSRVVRIRADAVSGRRFAVVPSPADTIGDTIGGPGAVGEVLACHSPAPSAR
ncbi:MAG: pyridoxamine 5'-phosphate oxidase family protein [Acidimicrobiales bacterium]